MNEIQSTEIKQIELEVLQLKTELAESIIRVGRLQLGIQATLKQICNHVAPQFGLRPKDCLDLMLFVKEGIRWI